MNIDKQEIQNVYGFNFDETKTAGLTANMPFMWILKISEEKNYVKLSIEKNDSKLRYIFVDGNNVKHVGRWNTMKSFDTTLRDLVVIDARLDELSTLSTGRIVSEFIEKFNNYDLSNPRKIYRELMSGHGLKTLKRISNLESDHIYKRWYVQRVKTIILGIDNKVNSSEISDDNKELWGKNKHKKFNDLIRIVQIYWDSICKKEILEKSFVEKFNPINIDDGLKNTEYRVEDIMLNITNKKLVIPIFQRNYIWDHNKICSLLNSLYLNYPVGTLLFASHKEIVKTKNIVVEALASDKNGDESSMILDGQQRVTSLLMAYFAHDLSKLQNTTLEWNKPLVGTMKEIDKIAFVNNDIKPFLTKIEFNKKYKKKLFSDFQLSNEHITRKVKEVIKEYKVSVIETNANNIDRLIDIFDVINKDSTKLSNIDLANSIFYSLDKNFDLHGSLKKFRENSNIIKDFDIDNETIINIWKLLCDMDSKEVDIKLTPRNLLVELMSGKENNISIPFINHQVYAMNLLEEVIKLLSKNYGFYSNKMMPNKSFILALAAHLHQGAKGDSQKLSSVILTDDIKLFMGDMLKKSVSLHFSTGTIVKISAELKNYIINKKATKKGLDNYISISHHMKNITHTSKGALFKAFVGLMALNEPVSLVNGMDKVKTSTDKWGSVNKDLHHFIPTNIKGKGRGALTLSEIDNINNITLISKEENRENISNRSPYEYLVKDKKLLKRISQTHMFDFNDLINIIDDKPVDFKSLLKNRGILLRDKLKSTWSIK